MNIGIFTQHEKTWMSPDAAELSRQIDEAWKIRCQKMGVIPLEPEPLGGPCKEETHDA